jgi:hypothetical protein
MNWKSTCCLLGATIGLFAFIFFYERHLGKTPPPPPPVKLAPGLDAASVSAIEVIAKGATNRVELRDARWRLVQPLAYPAEKLYIEALLKACSELTPHTSISATTTETQPQGAADYGFNPPQIKIRITQQSGDVVMEIGKKSPSEKFVYVRADGTDGIKIVDAGFLNTIPVTSKDWRNRDLVALDDTPFDRLAIQTGSGGFELSRISSNATWNISLPPPVKRADNFRVAKLIQFLLIQKITDFVTDDPKADLDAYGLKTPAATLSFSQGTNAPIAVVQFGGSPTNQTNFVYARRSTHTNIVVVPKALLNDLNTPFSMFRDRQLLSFLPETIQQIDIKAEEVISLQRQTNDAWKITSPFPMPADKELVGRFMTNLMSLNVVTNGWVSDVVADYSQFGLAPPRRSYSIFKEIPAAATNSPFATIAIGLQPTNEFDTVLARRLPEEPVYKVALGIENRLPKKAFQLRDRQIWNFNHREAKAITISDKGAKRKLIRNGQKAWIFAEGSQGIINSAAIDAQVLWLGQLRAAHWAHQSEDPRFLSLLGFSDQSYAISIETHENGATNLFQIQFGKMVPPNIKYAAVKLEGRTTVFQYPLADYLTLSEFLVAPKE